MPDAEGTGQTLLGLNVRQKYGVNVLAIHRGERFLVAPAAEMLFEADDTLLVLGKREDIEKLDA